MLISPRVQGVEDLVLEVVWRPQSNLLQLHLSQSQLQAELRVAMANQCGDRENLTISEHTFLIINRGTCSRHLSDKDVSVIPNVNL